MSPPEVAPMVVDVVNLQIFDTSHISVQIMHYLFSWLANSIMMSILSLKLASRPV